ncbi:hypothetical protein NUH88_16465 [Nisaea acidiphila]|uniref:Uncharacterized protein n=1 Tax=Nisaea acidiphila TaxID=1862145 RepID=A0A9J7AQX0_9PROT|nr:hypothetical protein [Nisaea acidiphila]UUX48985.1 hypothetical protein NUH88_16465 [Nisaea acidiphila]
MDDAAIKQQYDAVITRAGLKIPADREDTMLNTYRNVLEWSEMVRNRPRPATLEPSNAYFLETITRVIESR